MSMKYPEDLSQNFTLKEMCRSSTAIRLGIDNTRPDEQAVLYMEKLCFDVFELVRNRFARQYGFTPQSVFRCEALEKILCVKAFRNWCHYRGLVACDETWVEYFSRKQHPKGQAGDIEIVGLDNLELAQWIRDNCIFDQLILEHYDGVDPNSGWVHVSVAAQPRGEILTMTNGRYVHGLPKGKV